MSKFGVWDHEPLAVYLYIYTLYRYMQRLEIQFAYQKDGMEEIVAVYLR